MRCAPRHEAHLHNPCCTPGGRLQMSTPQPALNRYRPSTKLCMRSAEIKLRQPEPILGASLPVVRLGCCDTPRLVLPAGAASSPEEVGRKEIGEASRIRHRLHRRPRCRRAVTTVASHPKIHAMTGID